MHPSPERVAVVTGAASGIGRAFVAELMRRGYACVAADLDADGLAKLCAEMGQDGKLKAAVTDVSVPTAVERMFDLCLETFGHVDLLVNNAGILHTGQVWTTALETWRRVIDIDLFGMIHTVRSLVPHFVARRSGHVINIASLAALTASGRVGPYSVAKHGVFALSESLAKDLLDAGSPVKVSVVFPGAVDTPIAQRIPTTGEPDLFNERLRAITAAGMAPSVLVELVLDAAAQGRFAIFPHHDVPEAAMTRLRTIISGELRPPVISN